ncbi:MAG: hypothetical protein P8Z75_15705 [Gammaproteobacteria bacterium]|jgi:predicted hotdog family 3-hydroxylacyl-ACP dehydratase
MSNELDIRNLVPHDGSMLLLDRIDEIHANGLTASVVLNEHSPFAEARGVPAWVGVEYMGQAIAAYAGVCARRDGEPLRIGFLVGTRRYEPGCNYFPLGARLAVTVEAITGETTGLQVFYCTISGEGIDVSANLNVYMPENLEEFMQENPK